MRTDPITIKAAVQNIIYCNEANHYAVLVLACGREEITATGCFPYVREGDTVEITGEYTVHPSYGRQFAAASCVICAPEGKDAVLKYLSSGAIKGIGETTAKRIVKKFGADAFRIMEEEPERLAEIKGISLRIAMKISEQALAKSGIREAMMYLQNLGIGPSLAARIYEKYGPALYSVIKNNPYQLAEDMEGIGFKVADSIAMKSGLEKDSTFRIRCGLLYVLQQALASGHTWLPSALLVKEAEQLLDTAAVDQERIRSCLGDLQIGGLIMVTGEAHNEVSLSSLYYIERNTAYMLSTLAIKGESSKAAVESRLREVEKETGIELDELQREAVRASVENGVLILTGGPGTGKTTTINSLIRYYEKDHREIMLAAPTGRAARRMAEATGKEAKTIHRLLEYTGVPGDEVSPNDVAGAGKTRGYGESGNAGGAGSTDGKGRFLRDEKDPLEAEVLIIDEMSMVDCFLMEALLKAVVPGTRLILVGDSDQLPSVGPGNVLKDLIGSGKFRTVRLTHIFRQAALSDIVMNAHRINHGETVDLSKKSRDFLFIRGKEPEGITEYIKTLIVNKLPPYIGKDRSEIQVLTPTRKGALGVENLNRVLQGYLNPPSPERNEIRTGDMILREGDKVMQIRNDYGLEWRIEDEYGLPKEQGSGIFNGDMGVIESIEKGLQEVKVRFDDDRKVDYDVKHLQELELSYAVTVHKSQGSEYAAVIVPMYYGPHPLMNRNLLYTAVTRARKCVCLVGLPEVFSEMTANMSENKRYTGLGKRLEEVFDTESGIEEAHPE